MRLARLPRCAAMACAVLLAACSTSSPRSEHNNITHHSDADANQILFRAIALVGTPYRWGGNTPEAGFDCSGFVDYVYHDAAGIVLPRTVDDIDALDSPRVGRGDLASGDLVLFRISGRGPGHVGIYVGDGRFVHAPKEGGSVRLDRLDNVYWREHYYGAKRVL